MAILLGDLVNSQKTKIIVLASTEVAELIENMGISAYENKLKEAHSSKKVFFIYHSNGCFPNANKFGTKLNYSLYLCVMTGFRGLEAAKAINFNGRVFPKEASCFISNELVPAPNPTRLYDLIVASNTSPLKRLDIFINMLPRLLERGLRVCWVMLGASNSLLNNVRTKFGVQLSTNQLQLKINSVDFPNRKEVLQLLADSKALLHLNLMEGGPRSFGEALLCATSIFIPHGFQGGAVLDLSYAGLHSYRSEDEFVDLISLHSVNWESHFFSNYVDYLVLAKEVRDAESRLALSGCITSITQRRFIPGQFYNNLDVRLPNHANRFLSGHTPSISPPHYTMGGFKSLSAPEFLSL